jgi:hypothetical protein
LSLIAKNGAEDSAESFYPIAEIFGMSNHLIETCDFDLNWTNRSIFQKNME